MLILTSAKYALHAMIAMGRIKIHAYAGHLRQTSMQLLTEDGTMIKTSTSDIKIIEPAKGQWISGWITSTQTSSGDVMYGPFDTVEQATAWANNLTSAVVMPVYVATTNQG